MVRALASHQFVPGSIPGLGFMCGFFLLLVLFLAPRGFFSGYSGFPFSTKTNISKFQFDLDHGQALYHERLARDRANTPCTVFDIKFANAIIYLQKHSQP